jgi:hypothetical protein
MAEFLKHLGPLALGTCLQLLNYIWKISVPCTVEKAIITSMMKAKETSFRTIQLSIDILNKCPCKNYGKNY